MAASKNAGPSIYDARATRRKRDDVHVREGAGHDGGCGAMDLAWTESELTAETSAPCKTPGRERTPGQVLVVRFRGKRIAPASHRAVVHPANGRLLFDKVSAKLSGEGGLD